MVVTRLAHDGSLCLRFSRTKQHSQPRRSELPGSRCSGGQNICLWFLGSRGELDEYIADKQASGADFHASALDTRALATVVRFVNQIDATFFFPSQVQLCISGENALLAAKRFLHVVAIPTHVVVKFQFMPPTRVLRATAIVLDEVNAYSTEIVSAKMQIVTQ
jgi:hypothetical protein